MSINSFFKPVPKPEDAAKLATKYELRFSRSSKVVEWDDGLFTDCRPSEADDAMDETLKEVKRYDHAEADNKGFGNSLAYKKVFSTLDEANAAAERHLNDVLAHPVGRTRANQADVANGELPPGYQLPKSDDAAIEVIGSGGRGTYTGHLTFFCDPYGADVWNVCVTEYVVRVVVEGDRSAAPAAAAASKAAGKARGGKAAGGASKPATASKAKAASQPAAPRVSASRTSIAKPHGKGKQPRVGIVSVPGMSKKEVAALNQQARASAAAMRSAARGDDDSDDDYGYSGLKGRSAAFWEEQLL